MSAPEVTGLPDDWTEEQVAFFNRVYAFIMRNRDVMCHPRAMPVPNEHWHTIAHNAAFAAAELRDAERLRIIDDETQETIAESPPEKLNS